jgi:hypothetical protein
MDQAASAHQALSGHERECGENANLVRRVVKQRATLSRLGVETASNSFHLGV